MLGLTTATGCKEAEPLLPAADAVVHTLVEALSSGDLTAVPFLGGTDAATSEYGVVMKGLGDVRPDVTANLITYDTTTNTAVADLTQSYAIGGSTWTYQTKANLDYLGSDGWRVHWTPTLVHPGLDGYTRLSLTSSSATRGSITAADGTALVWNRPVYRVGIDKTKVSGDQTAASARALAGLLGINADTYVKAVQNGGPQQFVIAVTLREGQVPAGYEDIPGALAQSDTASLGPSPTWAIGLLGAAGEATADDILAGGGAIQQGDVVGHSGLQARYDAYLRGTPGYTVWLAPRAKADVTTPAPTPRPTSTPLSQRQKLWGVDPTPGGNLATTLDPTLQTKAEDILAGQTGVAALVVLDWSTGAIRVAANSPASGANPYATIGRYAPGSTFKLATALAALRSGYTLDSPVDCPVNATVSGQVFKNVTGYSHNGRITLREAVAYSCNTAMVNISRDLPLDALTNAAASLGIGNKADLGFASFLGNVPPADSHQLLASDSFGQGTIEASPLAMATEAASVAAGHTVTPYLIAPASPAGTSTTSTTPSGTPATPSATTSTGPAPSSPPSALPTSDAAPLTAAEAASLQAAMQAVVQIGSGASLKGLVIGAKSGTAEFSKDGTMLTHAWMIAYTDTYAIAAYVDDGQGGTATAGPLVAALLS